MKEIINSIYYPESNSSNSYVKIVRQCMEENGIKTYGFKYCIKNKIIKNMKIINLNWFETKIDNRSILKTIFNYMLYSSLFLYFRLRKLKIIVTMHNSITHDCYYPKLSISFFKKILCYSDSIIVMNRKSKKILSEMDENLINKVAYIPHPTYSGIYPEISNQECKENCTFEFDNKYMNLLFLGQIKPYKNIEIMLKVSEKLKKYNIRFYICGKPSTKEYSKELINRAKSLNNVFFKFGFLNDIEMISLIKSSTALILPYNLQSSLNSGTSILAFSNEKTVIGSATGTLLEYPSDLVFSYEYNSEDDHINKLIESILKAYDTFEKDSDLLEKKGKELKKLVDLNNSMEKIGEKYSKLYNKIVVNNKDKL